MRRFSGALALEGALDSGRRTGTARHVNAHAQTPQKRFSNALAFNGAIASAEQTRTTLAPSVQRAKKYRFADMITSEVLHEKIKGDIQAYLVEQEFDNPVKQDLARILYETLRRETFFEFGVDALALNVASVPFIINDMTMGAAHLTGIEQKFRYGLGTRATAFIPNSVIGRPNGVLQDYGIPKYREVLKIDTYKEHLEDVLGTESLRARMNLSLAEHAPEMATFATNQTGFYGLFLLGGAAIAGVAPNPLSIGMAMVTLTVAASYAGPLADKIYQGLRKSVGLPAKPWYRLELEKMAEERRHA